MKHNLRNFWLASSTTLAVSALRTLKHGQNTGINSCRFEGSATALFLFGRIFSGLGPWLSLPRSEIRGAEAQIHSTLSTALFQAGRYLLQSIPLTKTSATIVDLAYLSYALVQSRNIFWDRLDIALQERTIALLVQHQASPIETPETALAASLIEFALHTFLSHCNKVRMFQGLYLAVESLLQKEIPEMPKTLECTILYPFLSFLQERLEPIAPIRQQLRARLYAGATSLLQHISPDGYILPTGTSPSESFNKLISLSYLAWYVSTTETAPDTFLPLAGIRGAVSASLKRFFRNCGFTSPRDARAILRAVDSPSPRILTSSGIVLYSLMPVFTPLALPQSHLFWTAPYADWTSTNPSH